MSRSVRGMICLLASLFVLSSVGCGDDDGGATEDAMTSAADTAVSTPDAPSSTLDASRPDAVGSTLDADVNAPDADPNAPDAEPPPPDATPNQAPTASFTMAPGCTMTNSTGITFTSTSTDPDIGDTLMCSWTFSSGTPGTSTQCVVTGVTFPNFSPYTVTLMVSDGKGGTDSTSMKIAPCGT